MAAAERTGGRHVLNAAAAVASFRLLISARENIRWSMSRSCRVCGMSCAAVLVSLQSLCLAAVVPPYKTHSD